MFCTRLILEINYLQQSSQPGRGTEATAKKIFNFLFISRWDNNEGIEGRQDEQEQGWLEQDQQEQGRLEDQDQGQAGVTGQWYCICIKSKLSKYFFSCRCRRFIIHNDHHLHKEHHLHNEHLHKAQLEDQDQRRLEDQDEGQLEYQERLEDQEQGQLEDQEQGQAGVTGQWYCICIKSKLSKYFFSCRCTRPRKRTAAACGIA